MERRSIMRPGLSELSSAAGLGRPEGRRASKRTDVALFGEVVAALVETVDGALDFGDFVRRWRGVRGRGLRRARGRSWRGAGR